MTSKIQIWSQIQNFLKNLWEFPPNFWTNSRSSGQFFWIFHYATLSFLSTRKWLVVFRNHQNFNVSVQIASNVDVNSEFDKNWCSFHYIEKWIWQCIILNLTKIWIFLVNLPKKFTLALGQFSNVPRAAGNFRKFPSCAARPRENFRKFPAALGKFQKLPSGSGKFLGKFPQKIKIFGTNICPTGGSFWPFSRLKNPFQGVLKIGLELFRSCLGIVSGLISPTFRRFFRLKGRYMTSKIKILGQNLALWEGSF